VLCLQSITASSPPTAAAVELHEPAAPSAVPPAPLPAAPVAHQDILAAQLDHLDLGACAPKASLRIGQAVAPSLRSPHGLPPQAPAFDRVEVGTFPAMQSHRYTPHVAGADLLGAGFHDDLGLREQRVANPAGGHVRQDFQAAQHGPAVRPDAFDVNIPGFHHHQHQNVPPNVLPPNVLHHQNEVCCLLRACSVRMVYSRPGCVVRSSNSLLNMFLSLPRPAQKQFQPDDLLHTFGSHRVLMQMQYLGAILLEFGREFCGEEHVDRKRHWCRFGGHGMRQGCKVGSGTCGGSLIRKSTRTARCCRGTLVGHTASSSPTGTLMVMGSTLFMGMGTFGLSITVNLAAAATGR
jgi:hypothetical protein